MTRSTHGLRTLISRASALALAVASLLAVAISAPAQTFQVLHSFTGAEGMQPTAGLTPAQGNIYGTSEAGGQYGHGTVWEFTP